MSLGHPSVLDEFSIPPPIWTPAIQGYPRLLLIGTEIVREGRCMVKAVVWMEKRERWSRDPWSKRGEDKAEWEEKGRELNRDGCVGLVCQRGPALTVPNKNP